MQCRLADNYSGLQSFFIFHSFGGGMGFGFGTIVLEHLSKESQLEFSVYLHPLWPTPSRSWSLTTWFLHWQLALLLHSERSAQVRYWLILRGWKVTLWLQVDNEAIYDICKKNLGIGSKSRQLEQVQVDRPLASSSCFIYNCFIFCLFRWFLGCRFEWAPNKFGSVRTV